MRAIEATDIIEKVASDQVVVERLDYVYDIMRLVGAVLGLKAILETVVGASDPKLRLAAAKELIKLDEEPSVIVERLRSLPVANLSVQELEAIVETGQLDPEKALQTFQNKELTDA